MVNQAAYQQLIAELAISNTTLVAVSKFKPADDIAALYELGQRDFGENYVQELCDKAVDLPKDIHWHFIGHLQTNKVKYIAPFVHLIHGVDSLKLLTEINKQALKSNRIIDCLLQVHIADEETKFGFDATELFQLGEQLSLQPDAFKNIRIRGLMGMASFTEQESQVRQEFNHLKQMFAIQKGSTFLFQETFNTLSMGMSNDYKLAIAEGANMVRIGSLLFGRRN